MDSVNLNSACRIRFISYMFTFTKRTVKLAFFGQSEV